MKRVSTRNDELYKNNHLKYVNEVLSVANEAHKASRTTAMMLAEEFDMDKKAGSPKKEKIVKPITNISKLEKLSKEIRQAKRDSFMHPKQNSVLNPNASMKSTPEMTLNTGFRTKKDSEQFLDQEGPLLQKHKASHLGVRSF